MAIKTHVITMEGGDMLRRWFTLGDLRDFVAALDRAELDADTPIPATMPFRVEYDPENPNPDRGGW